MTTELPHNENYNTLELLQPELLSNDRLISILEHRHVKLQNLNSYSREMLLQLFNSFAVPLPQRKRRDDNNLNSINEVTSCRAKTSHIDIEMVNHDYKRMKLNSEYSSNVHTENYTPNTQIHKRAHEQIVCIGETPSKKHRKKITWP